MAEELRCDLVFEGGGVKGAALAGAAGRLTSRGFDAQPVGGSSAGAIVAALYAAGYRDEAELRQVLLDVPFASFRDRSWFDHVPVVGPLASVIGDLGIYEGEALEQWMRAMLGAKGVRTFGDLRIDPQRDGFDHRCQIVVADLTDRRVLVLPRDAARLGLDPDEIDIARVVRASAAIPFFFEPVRFADGRGGPDHVLVDGGLLSNFPVWLFDVDGVPRWPTFGINLVAGDCRRTPLEHASPEVVPTGGHGLIEHVRAVIGTLIEARDKLALERADAVRTIDVPNLGVGTVDFDLTPQTAAALFDCGAAAVDEFLDTWSFDGYVSAFRTPSVRPPSTHEPSDG